MKTELRGQLDPNQPTANLASVGFSISKTKEHITIWVKCRFILNNRCNLNSKIQDFLVLTLGINFDYNSGLHIGITPTPTPPSCAHIADTNDQESVFGSYTSTVGKLDIPS